MKRLVGIAMMALGLASADYALYLLVHPAWSLMLSAVAAYTVGYHLYTNVKDAERSAKMEGVPERVSTSIQEARAARGGKGLN
jgi:hypothetical protein